MQQRQIDVRTEKRAEQRQRRDAWVEAKRRISAAQQTDLQQQEETEQNRSEQSRETDADRKVMQVSQGRRRPELCEAAGGRRSFTPRPGRR
jgi:hypothetical protein